MKILPAHKPNEGSTRPLNRRANSGGFSLVELMVVIAVIGIIASIAISSVKNLLSNSEEVTAKRNAQTIAQVASAAQAAGDDSIGSASDLDAAVQIVVDGVAGSSVFEDIDFTFSDISTADVTAAKTHLTFAGGTILYEPQN